MHSNFRIRQRAFVAEADVKKLQDFNSGDAFNLSKFGKEKLFNKITNYPKPIMQLLVAML